MDEDKAQTNGAVEPSPPAGTPSEDYDAYVYPPEVVGQFAGLETSLKKMASDLEVTRKAATAAAVILGAWALLDLWKKYKRG